MYFPYFITYIAIGFTLSIVVFIWALKTGQFREQQRARYLPLEEEAHPAAVNATRRIRFEIYTLFFLAFAGLAASGALLVYSLFFAPG